MGVAGSHDSSLPRRAPRLVEDRAVHAAHPIEPVCTGLSGVYRHMGGFVSVYEGWETSRLMDAGLDPYQRAIAAKFVVHFIGDIHQPLHTEGLLRGGNGIKVRFNGRNSNLHSVWDSAIAEHLIGGYTPALAQKWAGDLLGDVEGGLYSPLVDGWREGVTLADVEGSVMRWAGESNRLVCEVVVPEGGWETLEGKDLSGDYYDQAIGAVEMQVARAGVRLAEWLDLVAGGEREEL
ncbi:hypothetical protein V492_04293 [Pseudogymnoascus sp. VKM F-4246]|nr:hypothetical protein V492_04293 [Pseudogymnoascus sp. VKM F-4246]